MHFVHLASGSSESIGKSWQRPANQRGHVGVSMHRFVEPSLSKNVGAAVSMRTALSFSPGGKLQKASNMSLN